MTSDQFIVIIDLITSLIMILIALAIALITIYIMKGSNHG